MASGTPFPAFLRVEYDEAGGFRAFESAATDAINRTKRQFDTGFSEIQRIVETALARPRSANGALDIDSAGIRRAADDAKAYALATREIANSMAALAQKTGDTTEVTRLSIQAARAAAVEAEKNAASLNLQATAHERLQAELAQTVSATQRIVAAQNDNIAAGGQHRQAMLQIGQQLNDVTVSLVSGQQAGIVFAQQIPQIALAMQQMGGAAGSATGMLARFSTFLTSGLGIALTTAIPVLALMASNLFATGDAADDAGRRGLTLEDALSKVKFGTEEATKALREYNEEKKAGEASDSLSIQNSLAAAEARLQETIATRELTKAVLERQLAEVSAGPTGPGGQGQIGALAVAREIGARIDALNAQINDARETINNLGIERAQEVAQAAVDPIAEINQRYDQMADAATRAARANRNLTASLGERLSTIERNRRAEIDAERERNRTTRSREPSLPPVTLAEVRGILERELGAIITSGVRSAAGNARVGGSRGSLHTIGLAADIGLRNRSGERISREQIRAALAAEGIDIAELLGPGDRNHDDHFHVGFRRRRLPEGRAREAMERQAQAEARAAEALERRIDGAADAAARLRGQFDLAPRDIDRAAVAADNLNEIIAAAETELRDRAKLTQEQIATLEATIASARQTRDTLIPAAMRAPVVDALDQGDRDLRIMRLRVQGREDEAEALELQFDIMERIGAQTEDEIDLMLEKRGISRAEYEQLFEQLRLRQEMSREQERLNRLSLSVQGQLREVDDIRRTIETGIARLPDDARGALTGMVNDIRQQFNDLFARSITDSLFGQAFADLENEISNSPRARADRAVEASSDRASDALDQLARQAVETAERLSGAGEAANDNGKGDITVTGKGGKPDPLNVFNRSFTRLFETFLGRGSPLAATLGNFARQGLEGAAIGGSASSLLFGRRGSALGGQLGGALGNIAGKALSETFGKSLGSLGGALGPLGSIAGGLLGSALGGLLKKPKIGVANIGFDAGGNLSVASYSGNSRQFREQAGRGGDSVISTVERIAEQLGGSIVNGAGSVSIGIRDGNYRVDPTGRGNTRTRRGAIDFGEDAEAAVRFATMDLIKDGVIGGLRATTSRILQAGKDLDAALQKALDFESVFSRLKAYKDPVGAALDTLDKEFIRLRKIFTEASATTEEFAALEELYGIERARAVKEASDRVTSSLRGLFDDLTAGNDNRSLAERMSFARARYDPLAARVAAGDQSAYDDFANAARELLDIQRELDGSQTDYFRLLDEITALTRARIDAESNIASIAANRDSPFSDNGGLSGVTADNAPVVSAIQTQTQELLSGILNGLDGLGTAIVSAVVEQRLRDQLTPNDFRLAAGI